MKFLIWLILLIWLTPYSLEAAKVLKADGLEGKFFCLQLDNERLVCSGKNEDGVFLHSTPEISGQGQLLEANPIDLGTYTRLVDFCISTPLGPAMSDSLPGYATGSYGSLGEFAVCAIVDTGVNGSVVKCWGKDKGITQSTWTTSKVGDSLPVIDLGTTLNPISISCGAGAACVILEDHTVRCWGDSNAQMYPTFGWCNIGADYWGGAAVAVPLGTNVSASKVDLNKKRSCAQVNNTCVKCWGVNSYALYPPPSPLASDNCISSSSSEMGDNLPCIALPTGNVDNIMDFCNSGVYTCTLVHTTDGNNPYYVGCSCGGWDSTTEYLCGTNFLQHYYGSSAVYKAYVASNSSYVYSRPEKLSCGSDHYCIIFEDGTIGCAGFNTKNQMGISTAGNNIFSIGYFYEDRMKPASTDVRGGFDNVWALEGFTMATTTAGLLMYAGTPPGFNGVSRMSHPGDGDSICPTDTHDFGYSVQIASIAAATLGDDTSGTVCTINQRGDLKCVGDYFGGGTGTSQPLISETPGGTAVTGIQQVCSMSAASDYMYTVMYLKDGSVYCAGSQWYCYAGYYHNMAVPSSNVYYQMFLPKNVSRLSCGSQVVCVIYVDGTLSCWGYNLYGLPGQRIYYGTNNFACNALGGSYPSTCIDWIAPYAATTVDIGPRTAVDVVIGGSSFACALLDDQSVRCWGNIDDWLGYPPPRSKGSTQGVGNYPTDMGTNLPVVDVGGPVAQIAAGIDHVCALLVDGHVKCWGKNMYSQLGDHGSSPRGGGASDMGSNLPIVNLNTTSNTATYIAAGYSATCVVHSGGTSVRCWGYNQGGQIIDETVVAYSSRFADIPLGGIQATKVFMHFSASMICALSTTGRLYCWGNVFGDQSAVKLIPLGNCGRHFVHPTGIIDNSCTCCSQGWEAPPLLGDLRVCRTCSEGTYNPVTGAECLSCDPGYFSVASQFRCAACPVGTFTNRTGTPTECEDCSAGTYTDDEASTSCQQCQPGTYAAIPRRTKCEQCPEGQFSSNWGSVNCSYCSPGHGVNTTYTGCEECAAGYYSSGKTACIKCAPGSVSAPGATTCMLCDTCPPGQFLISEAHEGECVVCGACPPGKYSTQTNSDSCLDCPDGLYNPYYNSTSCYQCLERFTPTANRSACEECPLGTFSKRGSLSCQTCGPSQYAWENKTGCGECPENTAQNPLNATFCVCKAAYLEVQQWPNITCITCPPKFTCTDGNTVLNAGYWRISESSFQVYECPYPEACPSGVGTSDHCATGYSGVVCGVCASGYGKIASKCSACPDNTGVNVFLLFLTTAIIIVLAFVYLARQLRADAKKTVVAMISKQTIHYLQLVSVFGAFDMPWHQVMGTFYQSSDTASNTGIDFISFDCAYPAVDYYQKFIFYMILPFAMLVLSTLFFIGVFILKVIFKKEDFKQQTWTYWKAATLLLLFLVHTKVSTKTLELMNCREYAGNSFLVADLSISCETSKHRAYEGVAIAMLIIYVIGLPAFACFLLFKRRGDIMSGQFIHELRFLYEGYNSKAFWWEIVYVVKKLVIVIFAVFLRSYPLIQLYSGLLFLVCVLVSTVQFRPFTATILYKMDVISSMIAIFTLLSGMLFLEAQDVDTYGLSVCIVFINALMIAGFVLVIVKSAFNNSPLIQKLSAFKKPSSKFWRPPTNDEDKSIEMQTPAPEQ